MFKLAPLAVAVVLAGCSVAPKPFTVEELDAQMRSDRLNMFAPLPSAVRGLTLEQATEMALENNYELRLKMLEQAIANDQLELTRYDMLPELVAAAGYDYRTPQDFSRSINESGVVSSEATSSSEKDSITGNLTLAWNVLDFGVSYYQAQQTADQTLIAEQRRRKIVHNLVQEVRAKYWNAVGAQYLQAKVAPLLADAQDALEKSQQVEAERLLNPLDTLRYRKELIELVRQLEGLNNELGQARPELAIMLGLSPSTELELAIPKDFELLKPELKYTLEEMEDIALSHRPELIEASYQTRISALETRKAMVRLLPGLEVSLGHHYDSNTYLVDNDWTQGGVRISWNLFNLLRGRDDIDFAEAQEELVEAQRMALNMAVLSQVHVSWLEYRNLAREYERSSELATIGGEIHSRMLARQSTSAQSRLDSIKTASSALAEELRMFRAYAGLQEAYGRVHTTMGIKAEDEVGFADNGDEPMAEPELVVAPLNLELELGDGELMPEPELPVVEETPVNLLMTGLDEPELTPVQFPAVDQASLVESVMIAVNNWASAWRNQDVETYIDSYASDYQENSRSRWEAARRERLESPATISLDISNTDVISVDESAAVVEFDQDYLSDLYTDQVRKTLGFVNEDGQWKISSERSQPR